MFIQLIRQIFPQKVAQYYSVLNSYIIVYHSGNNTYSLRVDGLHQSGWLASHMWQTAFNRISINPKKVLVLGLGGGSIAHSLNQFWPQAKITGIEIDPLMVKLGKKYLNLKQAKNLTIKITDAFSYLTKTKTKFDLIIIDLFYGKQIPQKAKTKKFINQIKSTLTPNGTLLFNQLSNFQEKSLAPITHSNIQQVFPNTLCIKLPINWLIIAQK